jgi:hypothetical protein
MQTFTIQIMDVQGVKGIHALEEKHAIRIVEQVSFDSHALPGQAMRLQAFREWINTSAQTPTVDIKVAKQVWAKRKRQLQKFIR